MGLALGAALRGRYLLATVRGDNPASTDSRTFGYVRESAVLGSIRA